MLSGPFGPLTVTQNPERPTAWLANKQSLESRPPQQHRDPLPHLELTYDVENALLQGLGYETGGGDKCS